MIDKEQLSIMVKDIERYLADLEAMAVHNKKDLEEKEAYYAVSMILFAILNRTIDIGNEIFSGSSDLPMPGTYGETFELLAKYNILRRETAVKMSKLIRYRNVIAHNYYEVTANEMYVLKKNIYEVRQFIEEVKTYLQRR
jgi:uncharacterized protein YutE (UPF0331/DUF86 family)